MTVRAADIAQMALIFFILLNYFERTRLVSVPFNPNFGPSMSKWELPNCALYEFIEDMPLNSMFAQTAAQNVRICQILRNINAFQILYSEYF